MSAVYGGALLSHKGGDEAMVNTAGQCSGSLQREIVHPFTTWLALAFGCRLSLFGAVIP